MLIVRVCLQSAEVCARLVDSQTQTDKMDVSETDFSPIGHKTLVSSTEKLSVNSFNKQSLTKQVPECLNGNSVLSEAHYRMQSSPCSSPEPSNENRANGNERLKDCSDDDNLETLGRKVSEIINANRLISPIDNGNSDDVLQRR